jgi:hypothetical protein
MSENLTHIHPIILGFSYEWQWFKDNLSEELQKDFENLIKLANRHPHQDPEEIPFQQIIMSILIEHEKEINKLRKKLIPYPCENFPWSKYL